MGIKGLGKFLKSVEIEIEPEMVPKGATFVIDGNGWMFTLLKSVTNKEYGGGYDQFRDAIQAEVFYLKTVLELNLLVYFDGDRTKLKDDTRIQRRLEIEERWLKLYHHCSSKTGHPLSVFDIPKPIFAKNQLLSTLEELEIQTVTSDFEADQDMAIFSFQANQQGIPCYIYGEDSDFIAMHGVPFIRFSELNAKRYSEFMQDDAPDEISHSMARVFRREQIASICGMTEPQFIEWCLLSGNDFTASFDISDFDGLECEGIVEKDKKGNLKKKDDGYSRVKERSGDAKRIIKARGKDFRLNSSNPKLKMAIEFSRDFYELRDLSKYPIDPPDEEVQLVSLTAGDCAAITHWIDTHLKTRKLMTLQGVGVIGWTLMREMYCSQTDDSPAIDLLENVTPIHLNALERMLQQPHHHDPDYQFKHPNWHDLMFTHYYQLVCKFLLKHSRINLHHDSTEYHQIFNAELFYNLLEDETLKSAMGNLSIEPSNKSKTDSKKKIAKKDSSPKKSRQTPSKSSIQPAAAPQQKVKPGDLQEAKPVAKETKVSNDSNPVVSDRKPVANDTLPIDAYLDEILYRIDRDRVTIIQGETGCGKSSRIPVMLLEDSQRRGIKCRMMVSQPRRIAASSLMKRVRSTLGMQVGLRMGHGIRDESDDTNICFVTTGYLVRLLAFKPDAFRSHTHLIVDEVHERSIDGDVLCFLVKQLLTSNPNIRIVLMSATIHTDLYASYFSDSEEYYGDMKALSVGLRRFPIIINHIEDLQHLKQGKPEVGLLIKKIGETCNRLKGNSDPGIQFPKDQYAMVQHIIESRAVMGTGVLVFVAGMSDITDLQERFISFAHFDLYAIHSDIPFEEQESAFAPTPPNKIKIVIATNAAESSITLPDVDIVICLGMHKHITYDPITHRSLLQKTFISKASATQRAGRTGRVRPGEVYRIYSRKLFESFSDFETSEVLRTPLQETILSIRIMLEASPTFQGVIPVLEQLIEPPDTRNVENSFQYLYENGLISSYDDTGYLTPTGKLIGALPVGIALGRLIAYGVQLGVGEDAAKLAIALSQPKSPFRIASPIIHTDPKVYNDIVQTIFLSSHKFDRGQYSEPLMLLNLLTEWRKLRTERERERWAFHSGVVYARMRYFDSASSHLCTKLRQIVNSAPEENILTEKQRLNFLRLILAWTSEENILRMKPHRYSPSELTTLTITDKLLSPDQIESLFPSDDCLWQCNILAEVSYALPLKCNHLIDLGVDSSIRIFNAILSSKSQHTVSWIRVITPKHKVDYVTLHQEDEVNYNLLTENLHVIPANDIDVIQHEQQYITLQIKVDGNKKRIKQLNLLRETLSSFVYLILQPNHFVQVQVVNCSLTQTELRDAFLPPGTEDPILKKEKGKPKQIITFHYPEINAENYDPLFDMTEDIPLGLKLYHAYLSGYNKSKSLRVNRTSKAPTNANAPIVGSAEWIAERSVQDAKDSKSREDDVMEVAASAHSATWKIYTSGSFVSTIMPRFSVTGACLYAGKKTLFGTAHNCLALGFAGQLVRCEGVTLFPPGCAWLALALACVQIDSYQFMINQSFPDDEAIDLSQIDLAEDIAELVKDSRDGWVEYNPPLVRMLLELFSEWTD